MKLIRLFSVIVILGIITAASACSPAPTPVAQILPPAETGTPAPVPVTGDENIEEESADVENQLEDFDPGNFDDPTRIDNPWFQMKPGTQWIYEGVTQESGFTTPHRVIITITGLTKVIAGVRTVVTWDQDFSGGELVETELAFFAQDNEGAVWRLGEYPEVYEEGKLVEAPAWITGYKGARAGIIMPADPQLGSPSYSQGWGPAVGFTDRGKVYQTGLQTCVPVDCYEDILVIAESSTSEPDALQLKYYARGTGNVRVGWEGADATKENLELVEIVELDEKAMAEVHARALELEKRAYEISKEVYDQTGPSE